VSIALRTRSASGFHLGDEVCRGRGERQRSGRQTLRDRWRQGFRSAGYLAFELARRGGASLGRPKGITIRPQKRQATTQAKSRPDQAMGVTISKPDNEL
jgi:hypothetical protein